MSDTDPSNAAEALIDALPIFASDENRRVDAVVKEKRSTLAKVEAQLDENDGRIQVMADHLRNVKQELIHTQQLCDAKNREIETEDHMKQLAEREIGRIRADIARLEKESAEHQDKINAVQNAIFVGNDKMDQFRLQQNWNQEELEQWMLAARQKDDDNLTLQKYSRADELKIKELTLQIEKLTKEVQKKKSELDGEVTETQASQIELDKTAEEFRRLHRERRQLIKQWEDTIEAMQRRDEAIRVAGDQYQAMKTQLSERRSAINEKKQFLETEQANNKEVEAQISQADRVVGKHRIEFGQSQQALVEFKDEVEVLKNTLNKVAMDLGSQRSQTTNLLTELEDRKRRLDKVKKQRNETVSRLENEYARIENLEKRMKQAEGFHKSESARLAAIEKEVTQLKDETFKRSQELFKLRQEEANLIAEINGAQSVLKNLQSQIHKLDNESLKQQELIYNQEFQIQQLERKVARAQGERTDEEKKALNARIQVLQEELDKHVAEHTMLTNQMKKLELDLRAAKRKVTDLTAEREGLSTKITELNLDNDSAERELKAIMKTKEDDMVAQNILKLEVKRLRDILNMKADEVFGLQNRKYQLQMSMEEREQEIKVHKEMLRVQQKASEEDRHRAAMELKERLTKVEKLRNKYDILAGRLQQEGDEERSQAYYVIRAAQEREGLQREGDELDAKIRKAEKEIRAMENTLGLLFSTNEEIRTNLGKADISSEEAAKKQQLEEQYRAAADKLRFKRREIRELQDEVGSLEKSRHETAQEREFLGRQLEVLENKKAQVDKELHDQQAKLERAYKQMMKLAKDHRRAKETPEGMQTEEEKDFRAQELKDFNRGVLYNLTQVAKLNPEVAPVMEDLLGQSGIKMPSRPPSTAGSYVSRPGSSASTASARSQPRSARSQPRSARSSRSSVVSLG